MRRSVLRTGVFTAAIAAPLQILAGDLHGLNTLEHQPQKIAAMEGVWETDARRAAAAVRDARRRGERQTISRSPIPRLRQPDPHAHEPDGEVRG